jgi:hypothetical protein
MFGKHRHFTSASFAGSCDQNADVADVWANPSWAIILPNARERFTLPN